MIISIASGKGGTGKTSLMAAFASLAKNKVLCDADVDAADLHLLTDPKIKERHDFQGGGIAVIDPDKCTQCGLCRELCRWEAISEQFEVDSFDLNTDQTQAIEKLAKEKKMTVLGRIPFDPVFTKSMVQGKTIFEYNTESITGQAVKQVWRKIIESPEMNEKGNV